MVSVASGKVIYIGRVPSKFRLASAAQSEVEGDILWALKGVWTNYGIIVSVVFETNEPRTYSVRNWRIPLQDDTEARLKVHEFDQCSRTLPLSTLSRRCVFVFGYRADASWGNVLRTCYDSTSFLITYASKDSIEPEDSLETVESVGLVGTEMYMSRMHGGHNGGKTSSFKRCLFMKQIGAINITDILVAAIKNRPSPPCYIHLLQGGRAVSDVGDDATAFGCRVWDFACVITAVWPYGQGGTELALGAMRWLYNVAGDFLPLSNGAYGADLRIDPRDTALAAKAFRPNGPRLALLERTYTRSWRTPVHFQNC